MALYLIANGPMPTSAAFAPVATGTSIKTMLQIKPFNICRIVEWGYSFDATALGTPVKVELITTGTVFATVTASADVDITKLDDLSAAAASVAGLTLGTLATGYTATAEGTVTSVRNLDGPQFGSVLSQPFIKQFPLGQWPIVNIGDAGRIRVTATASVNMYCYLVLSI